MDNSVNRGGQPMPASLSWPAHAGASAKAAATNATLASETFAQPGKAGVQQPATASTRRARGGKHWLRWWPLAAVGVGGVILYLLLSPASSRFTRPVGTAFRLSGNFGELRPQHFHMGLDVRTDGEENLPVYAVADGYVSRIIIQEYSLGKAIFVTHPNGYTTVYAHLNRFYDELQTAVEQQQLKTQQREQDISFKPFQYPVEKGGLIARSGNTGGSEAPHLHFEVRDTKTGRNLNPLLHGYAADDDTPPVLHNLYWYNRQYSTYSSGANTISITGSEGNYRAVRPVIKVRSPRISLAMRATDKDNDNRFRFGIYRVEVRLDNKLVHEAVMDDIDETDTRYINACIDYSKWIRSGSFVQHLSTLPGNHLPAWKGSGLIDLADSDVHQLNLRLYDVNNNVTEFNSTIQYSGAKELAPPIEKGARILAPGKAAVLSTPNCKVSFTARTFYDTVAFVLKEQASAARNKASALVALHQPLVPVHEAYSVSLKVMGSVPAHLRKQIVMQLNNGQQKVIDKGKWRDDWLTASFNTLGSVQLLIDTEAPTIQLSGWNEGQTFSGNTIRLPLNCRDETAGVASFKATLNGQWLLYEQKGRDFVVNIPPSCKPGNHQVTVSATDVAGNTSSRQLTFKKG
ncbi:M23 family metallopeptidase [Paraflavitalea sp. CAU 1676]|uniref:M23 family metallopeptidase n=1 Tax=Paraflavitalea sp. CAU 1676 TaxID=3032598 RepID=UPI0023DB8347|nr:M23 family metallopeptidase [Paraflavitalea sp. CAU 1676]MDF2188582.1 M23 family metallopeptidase [Paraflavitalea sp. CAU 1676]